MRVRLSLLATVAFACGWFVRPDAQAQGVVPPDTPDQYGYVYKTSDSHPNEVQYNWVDIEQPANELQGLTDDNFVEISIPFSFRYYWSTYNKFAVGSNGYLIFGPPKNVASTSVGFETFPTSGPATRPNNYIGMLVSDLTFSDINGDIVPDAKLYAKLTEPGVFVVTYKNVPFWVREQEVPSSYRGSNSFQIILNGNDRSITVNYQKSEGQVSSAYQTGGQSFLVTGMENITGRIGLTSSRNQYPKPEFTIKYFYPDQPGVEVFDVAPAWLLSPTNQGFIAGSGGPNIEIKAGIKNTGNQAIVPGAPITVRLQMFSYLEGLLRGAEQEITSMADEVTITNLAADSTAVITFNKTFPTTSGFGDYLVQVTTENANDDAPENNLIQAELVLVDTTKESIALGYDRFLFYSLDYVADENDLAKLDANPQEGALGGGGLRNGMSIAPPFYPAEFESIDLPIWVISNGQRPDTLQGFKLSLYKGDGPDGKAGSLFYSEEINPNNGGYSGLFNASGNVVDYVPNFDDENGIAQGTFYFLGRKKVVLPETLKVDKGSVYIMLESLNENASRYDFVPIEQVGTASVLPPISFRSYEISGNEWAPYRERDGNDFALHASIKRNRFGASVSRPESLNGFVVGQTYPNPADKALVLPLSLPRTAKAVLSIRNLQGQLIETRELGDLPSGQHNIQLDASRFANGLYTYTVSFNGAGLSGKFTISR
jgi:hypothetical protein